MTNKIKSLISLVNTLVNVLCVEKANYESFPMSLIPTGHSIGCIAEDSLVKEVLNFFIKFSCDEHYGNLVYFPGCGCCHLEEWANHLKEMVGKSIYSKVIIVHFGPVAWKHANNERAEFEKFFFDKDIELIELHLEE